MAESPFQYIAQKAQETYDVATSLRNTTMAWDNENRYVHEAPFQSVDGISYAGGPKPLTDVGDAYSSPHVGSVQVRPSTASWP
jgi:hypothetical protein